METTEYEIEDIDLLLNKLNWYKHAKMLDVRLRCAMGLLVFASSQLDKDTLAAAEELSIYMENNAIKVD